MDLLARLKAIYWALPSRRARPASWQRNGFKTLIQSAILWLVFLGVGPLLAFKIENWLLPLGWPSRFEVSRVFCVFLFVLSWIFAWHSAWCLVRWGEGTPLPVDAPNRLVVRGIYRWIRNPMAFASLLQGASIGLFFGSPLILAYVLIGALSWNFAVRPWEEADLKTHFGTEFLHYQKRVRCWIPRFFPYRNDEK